MACTVHADGHVCAREGEGPHTRHRAWVKKDDADLGGWVNWKDPEPVIPPSAKVNGTFTNKEIVETIARVEGRVDEHGRPIGCQVCGGRKVDLAGIRCEACKGTGDQALLLARNNDPWTSAAAARGVDLTLDGRHEILGSWLRRNAPATYDEMAIACVALGLCERLERGRRIARTMREAHGLIDPAFGPDGKQMWGINDSGKAALCWRMP